MSAGCEIISAGPAQSSILTDREVVSLFLHFTVNPKPRVDFIDRPRCCLRGKECSITRFGQVESRWGYSGTSDRIRWEKVTSALRLLSNRCLESWAVVTLHSNRKRDLKCFSLTWPHLQLTNSLWFCCVSSFRFSVNRRIFVVGFGLYGSIHGPTDYQVNIQVWNKLTSNIVLNFYLCDINLCFLSLSQFRSFTQTVTQCWARMIQVSVVMGQPTPSELCLRSLWRYCQT